MRGLVLDFGGVLTDPGDDLAALEPPLLVATRQARHQGILTAVLSNADFRWRPPAGWEDVFDVVVTSGDVGLAKPDRRIYLLTAERLGLPAHECVFVDDLAVNVRGAAAAGMVGVHHQSVHSTLQELEILLDIPLQS
ncbi:HAD-IA family hydrolase [Actinosynnema sp. NPDC059335]|uniref:HAD-IA family hydrolase n=1 Tax=Actinosynnema sp. NPDC059335 TaxID=3346804 RepID=UPI00366EDF26